MTDYAALIPFCNTDMQRERLKMLASGKTHRQICKELGISLGSLGDMVEKIKSYASRRGWAPEHDMCYVVPDGLMVKGTSTLIDKRTGDSVMQWVKTTADQERQIQIMREISEGMTKDIPKAKPRAEPVSTKSSLMNCYVLSDVHVGMLAWPLETGDKWDLKEAERVVMGCYRAMVDAAQPADEAVICNLGDWVHSDGLESVTPTSGHILDQDGRFPKVVEISTRLLRMIVDLALKKHSRVHLIIAEGNHDLATSMHLRNAFKWGYENEPRLTIDESVSPYYACQFGKTMLGFHHGHLIKPEQMPGYFAAQYAPMWGATTKREIHCGHRHHYQAKEHPGITVVQHPTIAAKDAYAARHGFFSDRRAICTTYHREFGKVATTEVTPEMIL